MTFEEIIGHYKDGLKPLEVQMKTGEKINGYVEDIADGLVTVRLGSRLSSRRTTYRISQIAFIESYRC